MKEIEVAPVYLVESSSMPVYVDREKQGQKIIISKAKNAFLYDEKNRVYIDYLCGNGSVVLGHNYEIMSNALKLGISKGTSYGIACENELEISGLICESYKYLKNIQFNYTIEESIKSAINLAKKITRKTKTIVFDVNNYDFVDNKLVAKYNNETDLNNIVSKNNGIAAIIVEPISTYCGVIEGKDSFLEAIEKVCKEKGIILISDESVSGFRISPSDIEKDFKIKPDLIILGKGLSNGLQVGALGISKSIDDEFIKEENSKFIGVLVSEAIKCELLFLKYHPETYETLNRYTRRLCEALKKLAKEYHIKVQINYYGSMFSILFSNRIANNYSNLMKADCKKYEILKDEMLRNGIIIPTNQFTPMFVTSMHVEKQMDQTIEAFEKVLKIIQNNK